MFVFPSFNFSTLKSAMVTAFLFLTEGLYIWGTHFFFFKRQISANVLGISAIDVHVPQKKCTILRGGWTMNMQIPSPSVHPMCSIICLCKFIASTLFSRDVCVHGDNPQPVRLDLSLLWQRPCPRGWATDRGHGESLLIQSSLWQHWTTNGRPLLYYNKMSPNLKKKCLRRTALSENVNENNQIDPG